MSALSKTIEFVESKTTTSQCLFTLFSLIIVRILFEMLLIDNSEAISAQIFSHHVSFFLAVAATLSVILCLFANTRIVDTVKTVAVAFIIVPMVPILDYLYTFFRSYHVKYVYFTTREHAFANFITLLYHHEGSPVGMRTEAAYLLIASFSYVYLKTGSRIKSAAAALTVYSAVYWYFGSMILIVEDLQKKFGLNYDISPSTYPNIFILTFVTMVVICFYLHDEKMFFELIRDSRPERVLHYLIMVAYGIYFLKGKDAFTFDKLSDFTGLMLLSFGIMFAAIFSIVTNNIEDVEIDNISNRSRPSVTKSIEPGQYKLIGYSSLWISIYTFIFMGQQIILLMLSLIGLYYIYSVSPLRIKRVPVLSKFVIGYNSLICILIGYAYSGGNIKQFPASISTAMVLSISLCSNFIDIKDYYGDIEGRIRTLPNILGLKLSKVLISLMFLSSSIIIPLSISRAEILPFSILSSFVPIYFLLKKNYKELYVFISFESGFLMLLAYLLISS